MPVHTILFIIGFLVSVWWTAVSIEKKVQPESIIPFFITIVFGILTVYSLFY